MEGLLGDYKSSSEEDSKWEEENDEDMNASFKKTSEAKIRKLPSMKEMMKIVPNTFLKDSGDEADDNDSPIPEIDGKRESEFKHQIKQSINYNEETYNKMAPPPHSLSFSNKNQISNSISFISFFLFMVSFKLSCFLYYKLWDFRFYSRR